MTDKTFTVAGTSNLNGVIKMRFANDTSRIKVLAKNGHTEIVLVELPRAMSKVEIAQYLKDAKDFNSAEQQQAIAEYLERDQVEAKPAKQPKVKAEAKAKGSIKQKRSKPLEDIVTESAPKVDLSELEDAPF